MITTNLLPDGELLVTFTVDDPRPVSLVADINGWDPTAHPLAEEFAGRHGVTVTLPADTIVRFRYLADGEFFDDVDADSWEPNGYGQTHSVYDGHLHDRPANRSDGTDDPADVPARSQKQRPLVAA